jgi:hypothetical protein
MLVRTRARSRPFNLDHQDKWSERAERAVSLWQRHAAEGDLVVADIGAGNGRVARLIQRPQTTYIGYDLLPQHPTINRIDIRQSLPHPPADVAFLLGVIEYIEADHSIIEQLSDYTKQAVVSYVGFDESRLPLADRKQAGWVRHETEAATAERFEAAGFRLVDAVKVEDGRTTVWLWERHGSR